MDSIIEIAHGYGYLLYCIPVEKCLAVSCSVIVISVHDNSNTKEDQQEMREKTGVLRNGKIRKKQQRNSKEKGRV